jgi:hypothetical protein
MMGKILGIPAEPLPNGTENLRAVKSGKKKKTI